MSDHFDGERFFIPGLPTADKNLLDILQWKLKERATPWPDAVPAKSGVKPAQRVPGLQVTHIGHASYLVQVANQNILVDPVFADRVSPFSWAGPRRHNPPGIAMSDLPSIDAMLITHNHYDHMDTEALRALWKQHQPRMISPLGNDVIIRDGAAEIRVETGDWWSSFTLGGDIKVTIVPAYHWSSRSMTDRRMALWGGFMLSTPAGNIYCAGDTAFRDGEIFRQIRAKFDVPTLAMLPIGAYEPRWFMKTQHADPEEALLIADICGAKSVLGVHWGTFQLTDEGVNEPAERFVKAVRERGLDPSRFRPFLAGDVWEGQGC